MQRKLTVIVSADVVGYSGLMERDEAGTLERLKANRKAIFEPRVAAHGGRIVKLMGDGALVEFGSIVSAIHCACEIQQATDTDGDADDTDRIRYRIGITLGEVIVEDDDIYGDGVNVAARLQSLAPPGRVAVSRPVRDQAQGKLAVDFDDLGEHAVRNIERPVHVYVVRPSGGASAQASRPTKRVSVCVLPFANMSGEPEQEYFSDGITEDITTDLSKVSALWVAARNTAFRFKGQHVDVPQLARQLGVSHVLEGSVRKAGGRVRITAQLVDGATGGHVWAERYDRDLSDIFSLQDEISQAIVDALKLKLLPGEKKSIEQRGTTNAQAYNLYLMARQFSITGNRSKTASSEAIIRLCRRATEIDPDYARPWALMAYEQAGLRLYLGADREDGMVAAERAIALDASLAEAHAAKARVLTQRSLFEESRREVEIALRLDPEGYESNFAAGRWAFGLRRFAEAGRHYDKAAAVMENDYLAASAAVSCYKAAGDPEGARRAAMRAIARIEKIVAGEPDNGSAIGSGVLNLAILGEVERAKEWAERALLLDPDNQHLRFDLACTYVAWREFETAVDLLDAMFAKGVTTELLDWTRFDPDLDAVRDHPRFQALLARSAERLATPPTRCN